jgi:hypothetical protein
VLIYLGFLHADEMNDQGNPFRSHEEWAHLVQDHSSGICPDNTWDRSIQIKRGLIVPLIRSVEQPFQTVSVETEEAHAQAD